MVGSVILVLHFGGRRIERLDLETPVPAILFAFCTGKDSFPVSPDNRLKIYIENFS